MSLTKQFSTGFAIVSLLLATPLHAQEQMLEQEQMLVQPGPLEGTSPLTMPDIRTPAKTLSLSAHLSEGAPDIPNGLIWRVFMPEPDDSGKLPLVTSAEGGNAEFALKPGSYLVHVAYGRAGATKRIRVSNEPKSESFVLNAGGLKLDANIAGGIRIPRDQLRFSIYDDSTGEGEFNNGERALILPDVEPNTIVRLNAGTYHVVSTYGDINAVIRSDIRVDSNELTEATVEHRASQVTLKLVREKNGEAIADTAWSVISDSGEPVHEAVAAFATLVLAEGQYSIFAKNRDRLYEKEVTVVPGRNTVIELLPEDQINPGNEGIDAVD